MAHRITLIIAFVMMGISTIAQQKEDTVIVDLASGSKVIFTVKDKADLEVLKNYDFQRLFQDIIVKLEERDTTALSVSQDSLSLVAVNEPEEDWGMDDNDDDEFIERHVHRRGTTQSFNFDIGTNNFLSNGKFPDADNENYAVRPWGSWYVGINSIQRTRVSNRFFIEWGFGLSWYNFKFQKDNILLEKDDVGTTFVQDQRDFDFKKSKLTVSYLNASLIPMLDFGGRSHKPRFWDGSGDGFRIGVGPYVGYRIGSYSKIKYDNEGDTKKDKEHDSYYLENIRYGVRVQMGFRDTDIFFNYDLNNLFTDNRGPSLNAFSFGIIF